MSHSGFTLIPLLLASTGPGGASEFQHDLGSGIEHYCQQQAGSRRLLEPVSPRKDGRDLRARSCATFVLVETGAPGCSAAITNTALRIDSSLDASRAYPQFGPVGEQTPELELPGAAPGDSVIKLVEAAAPGLVEAPTGVEVPVPSAPGATATRAGEKTSSSAVLPVRGAGTPWLWYLLLPGALLVALLAFLLLAFRMRQRERDNLASTAPSKAARSFAFLESQDDSGQRHAMTRTAYRIGRHSDNDLSIRDSSISRQHAEIHRRRDGSFIITDLDSMNGVFVNQKKIDSVKLRDGDVIEIGDKSFRFRMK